MKKLFTTILACVVATTMMAQDYGTFYNSKYDVTLPSGVVAYIMTDAKPTYQKIADGDSNHKTIPAGTAVLLYTGGGSTGDVNPSFTSNLLHGSNSNVTTTGGGAGAKYYKLTYNNAGTVFGWYWGADGGAAFESPANKAWLALPAAAAGARVFLGLPGDNTDGVVSLENKQQGTENVWYNLNGCRINAPMAKGIYVKNGRKMVTK